MWWIYDSKTILHLILGHLVTIVQKLPKSSPNPDQPGPYLGAEISTISQKFLDIYIRIKIPNIFHIHHFLVYDLDYGHKNGGALYRVQCIVNFQNNFIYEVNVKGDTALDTITWGGDPPHGAISRPYTEKWWMWIMFGILIRIWISRNFCDIVEISAPQIFWPGFG